MYSHLAVLSTLCGRHGGGTPVRTVAGGVGSLVLASPRKTTAVKSRIPDRLRVADVEAPTRSGVRGSSVGTGALHHLAVQSGSRRCAQQLRLHVRIHTGIEQVRRSCEFSNAT